MTDAELPESRKDKPMCPEKPDAHTLPEKPATMRTVEYDRMIADAYERAINSEELVGDLAAVLNRHSIENGSNTPARMLAEVAVSAIAVFAAASNARERWYGVRCEPGYGCRTVPAEQRAGSAPSGEETPGAD